MSTPTANIMVVRIKVLGDNPTADDRLAVYRAIHDNTNEDVLAIESITWEAGDHEHEWRDLDWGGKACKIPACSATISKDRDDIPRDPLPRQDDRPVTAADLERDREGLEIARLRAESGD